MALNQRPAMIALDVLSLFYGGVRDASFSMVECNSSRSDCRLPISVLRSHLTRKGKASEARPFTCRVEVVVDIPSTHPICFALPQHRCLLHRVGESQVI